MKSNKGITLISLIIYIVIFTIVIGTIAMITDYFRENTDETVLSSNTSEQFTRFTTYLTDNLNSVNLDYVKVENNNLYIIYVDGTEYQYIYENGSIYYIVKNNNNIEKNINLCNEMTNCSFTYTEDNLKISVTINNITYNNNYVVKQTKEIETI